jgi:hypothetical protein
MQDSGETLSQLFMEAQDIYKSLEESSLSSASDAFQVRFNTLLSLNQVLIGLWY